MSIRARLILLILVVLLPALGAAAWVFFRTWQAGHTALDRQASEDTRLLAVAINGEFTRYRAIARALAASPLLDHAPQLTDRERAALDQTVRRAIAGSPVSVELVSPGVRWIDTRQPPTAPPRPHEQGTVRLATSPGIGALDAGPAGGVAVIEPVFRRGVEPAMNLRVIMPLAELRRLIEQRSPPEGWSGLLLDARGQVLVRHPAATDSLRDDSLDPLIRQSLAGRTEGRFALRSFAGEPLRVYFSRAPQGGWTYLTTVPRAQLDPALSNAPMRLLLGALLLLVLAVAVALWAARGEWRRQMEEAVERTRQAERQAGGRRERVEALGRLTGRVVHEFNNLLGVISNSAYLIQRQTSQPALAMPVAATLRAVDAASRLTQHLLRFGVRASGQPRTLSLSEWLPQRRDLLGVMLGRRVDLRIDVRDESLHVHVDPDELELALINLTLNAREALPEGGQVRITAEGAPAATTSDLPGGRYASITVRDNGPDGGATGFGLSQVHGLCAQAGGKAVLRRLGAPGTSVSLVLPAVDAQAGASGAPLDPDGPAQAPLKVRVLLAEDNESLGDVTAALIEGTGAHVERATHAVQALERLERDPPVDVLLTDVAMPGPLDGVALAHTVRRRWPAVHVVLISAHADSLTGVENFRVLRKPCPPATLLAALRQVPAPPSGATGPGTPHAPLGCRAMRAASHSTPAEETPWTRNP